MAHPRVPERVGNYRVARRLGSGGQGVVYEAYDEGGGRVAVKTLTADGWLSRPDQEVAALSRVASFCTARVLAYDLDAPVPYIVSELVDGPSLALAVRQGGPIRGDVLRRLAIGVATALTTIHEAGVVHRDLKPENVLLGPDGPRVIDFGIARILTAAQSTHGWVGTKAYMAPEAFRDAPVTASADIFAWASVMLFSATGTSPFHRDHEAAIVHAVLTQQPDVSVLEEPLRSLVAAALSKEPGDRPAARDLLLGLIQRGEYEARILDAGRLAAVGVRLPAAISTPAPLGEQAERAFQDLPPEIQALVPQVLLRMVSPGERTDGSDHGIRVAYRSEFDMTGPAVERLADDGLLVADGDEVRLPSAALTVAWPRLHGWVDDELGGIPLFLRLQEAARQWAAHGKNASDLLHGSALASATRWASTGRRHLSLNAVEREFLDAAAALAGQRARIRRLVTAALAVLLIIAVSAGAVAETFRRDASARRDQAVGRYLATTAAGMRAVDPALAMGMAASAARLADLPETRGGLISALSQPELSRFAPGGTHGFSPDGSTVVSVKGATASVFDVRTARELTTVSGLPDDVLAAAIDSGERLLAVATQDRIQLFDLATGTSRGAAFGSGVLDGPGLLRWWPGIGPLLEFSPSGGVLIARTRYEVRAWSVAERRQLKLPPAVVNLAIARGDETAAVDNRGAWDLRRARWISTFRAGTFLDQFGLSFDASGRLLAISTYEGVRLADPHAGTVQGDLYKGVDESSQWTRASFSPDGALLAASAQSGGVAVWRVGHPSAPILHYASAQSVKTVWFAEGGRRLRFATTTGAATDLDLTALVATDNHGISGWPGVKVTAMSVVTVAGVPFPLLDVAPTDSVVDAELSDDGTRLAVGLAVGATGVVGRVDVYDVATRQRLLTQEVPNTRGVALSPDGRWLAVAASGHLLIDLSSHRVTQQPMGQEIEVMTAVAFSRDSRTLAGATIDGQIHLWDLRDRRLTTLAYAPKVTTNLLEHRNDEISAMAFSDDGHTLAAGGSGWRIRMWDLPTGIPLGDGFDTGPARVTSLTFRPGSLVAADDRGLTRSYLVEPSAALAAVCARGARNLTPQEWRRYAADAPQTAACT